jgi:hypothetical protein
MAAGLGFKDFVTGEVLTAADVDGYLMQNIWVFANAAARDAAVTSPQEGNACYLKDTDAVMTYSGSAWVAVGGSVPTSYGFSAGKNTVINGGMEVWQRGTAATAVGSGTFLADRWQAVRAGFAAGATQSRQATGDTTNLPDIQYCARVQRDSGNTSTAEIYIGQNYETVNSIPLAGETMVFSFYARRGANYSAASNALGLRVATGTGTDQNFITGSYTGSTNIYNATAATLTTTWTRFSVSFTVGATATELGFYFNYQPVGTAGANDYFEVTGVQLELGTTATLFSRNASTYQGELAACQRYYYRAGDGTQAYGIVSSTGWTVNSTTAAAFINLPVRLRAVPTAVEFSNIAIQDTGLSFIAVTSASFDTNSFTGNIVNVNLFATGITGGRFARALANNSTSGYLALTAEI